MIVIFDFEEEIYQQAGVPVEYVGHPLVDMVRPHLTREEFFAKVGLDPAVHTIALLPGSRQKEVIRNLPEMLGCGHAPEPEPKATIRHPRGATIDPSLAGEHHASSSMLAGATVRTAVHATYDALQHSDVRWSRAARPPWRRRIRERPMVVVYRVSALTWLVGKLLVKVPFTSIVNILAKKELVPELMQQDFNCRQCGRAGRIFVGPSGGARRDDPGISSLETALGKGRGN